MSLYTPAARQPGFACPQCPRQVFDRAALKNHIRAKHQSLSIGRFQPLPAHQPTTPLQSSNEEPIPIPGTASPAITENRIQLPLPNDDDHNYDEHSDFGGSTASHSSTFIPIPSSPSHGPMTHAHANDKCFRRRYHLTLNGEGFLIILNLL
jgi:hypothetical protein